MEILFLVIAAVGFLIYMIAVQREGHAKAFIERRLQVSKRLDPAGIGANYDPRWEAINRRFPEYRFPRISREAAAPLLRERPDAIRPDFRDDDWHRWNNILEDYPSPPRTDAERQHGESQFWRAHAEENSVGLRDGRALLAKQEIIDRWWSNERHLFREYFAATGNFIPSIWTRQLLDAGIAVKDGPLVREFAIREMLANPNTPKSEKKKTQLWLPSVFDEFYEEPSCPSLGYASGLEKRSGAEFEKFNATYEAHRERWGEWYFANVERAFNAQYGERDEDGAAEQKAHGDARVATEEEARAAGTGSTRRSSVHDQEF